MSSMAKQKNLSMNFFNNNIGYLRTYPQIHTAATKIVRGDVLTYTSSDGGAVFTGALARAAGENVGVYAINQGSLSAGANYTITFVSANFTIVIADQTINFPQPPDKNPGAPDFTVSATATSGLPVSFSSKTLSVCTVSLAGRVHLLKVGTCTLAADQDGNSNYNAAPQVTRSFTVTTSVPIDYKVYMPLIFR